MIYDDYTEESIDLFHTCPECKEECTITKVDDSFDYSGTHCTGGQPGTHHIPIYYVSECCEAEVMI